MTTTLRLTAHAPTVSRDIRHALDGTGIALDGPGAFGYTATQTAADVVEVEWHGPEDSPALGMIAAALDGPYDVRQDYVRRGTQSSFPVAILRVTPGTPVAAVEGTEATADDVTAASYVYRAPWDPEDASDRHSTASEARDALDSVRAEHGAATIDRATGVITLHMGKARTERHTMTPSTPQQRAAHRRELLRSAAHWADQARRDAAEADRLRSSLLSAHPASQHHINTRIEATEDRARRSQEAADEAEDAAQALDDQPEPEPVDLDSIVATFFPTTADTAPRRTVRSPEASCVAPHSPSCSCAGDEYRYCSASLGRTEYPFTCNRRVAHNGPCGPDRDVPGE